MTRKFVSLVTTCALICCLSGTLAFGMSGSDAKEPAEKAPPVEKSKANEKLKADVNKLLADTKAGKIKMPAQQFPQPTRNNLSTGAKIGIIAAIAGAIVLIAIVKHVTSD